MDRQVKQIVITQSAVRKVGGKEAHKEADRVSKYGDVKSTLLTVIREAARIIIL